MDNPFSLLSVFTVHQAACAIVGVFRPTEVDQKEKVRLTEIALKDHIDELTEQRFYVHRRVVRNPGGWAIDGGSHLDHLPKYEMIPTHEIDWTRTTITRARLLAWCESRGIRPPLLFPEPTAEKPLHGSERKSLFALIRALAELHGIKSGDGAYRKEALALVQALAEKRIHVEISEKTIACHLKDAFKLR